MFAHLFPQLVSQRLTVTSTLNKKSSQAVGRTRRTAKNWNNILQVCYVSVLCNAVKLGIVLSLSQEVLGEVSSNTSTRPPTVKCLQGLYHFWGSCIIATYSHPDPFFQEQVVDIRHLYGTDVQVLPF